MLNYDGNHILHSIVVNLIFNGKEIKDILNVHQWRDGSVMYGTAFKIKYLQQLRRMHLM